MAPQGRVFHRSPRCPRIAFMASSEKLDLFKQFKDEYVTPKQPALVRVKTAKYLAIEGEGEPGGPEFQEAVGALYAAAFGIKMRRKHEDGVDYTVAKLEGLWRPVDPKHDFSQGPPKRWHWTLMIRTPDFIRAKDLETAVAAARAKGKTEPVEAVELCKLSEGLCVQVLHVGPWDQEAPTIALMQAFMETEGLEPNGQHHEIYLSDPRRVAPEKLKTILRHPVKRKK